MEGSASSVGAPGGQPGQPAPSSTPAAPTSAVTASSLPFVTPVLAPLSLPGSTYGTPLMGPALTPTLSPMLGATPVGMDPAQYQLYLAQLQMHMQQYAYNQVRNGPADCALSRCGVGSGSDVAWHGSLGRESRVDFSLTRCRFFRDVVL